MKQNNVLAISFLVVVALAGCSSTPDRNARLEDARNSYRDAQSDPQVANLAALELKEAGDALAKANNASNQRQDPATVDHLAYLAQRRVAIAQETAKRKGAEATVSQADAERDKIRLAARTEEADKSQRQAQDSEMRVRQLESQLNELNAKQTDRGLVITLGDVLFDTNRAQLKSGGVREVQKLADALKQNPQRTVFIEGFTDSTGTESRNQELSEQRAIAVRDTLLGMGVASNRITTSGYGKSFPVASNDTEAGRQLNRRVEIIISDESGSIRSR
ncbi:MAG: OmpA family protein [Nitrosospira sp.]|nr:OmpA family protein [Nitrosospira sp.]